MEPAKMQDLPKCIEIVTNIQEWFRDRNYVGLDPYLLDAKISSIGRIPIVGDVVVHFRQLLKPFHSYIPKSVFSSATPVIFPKGLGLILGGSAHLNHVTGNPSHLSDTGLLLDLLEEHRSPGFKHLCWGHPFSWGGKHRFPPYTPAVCVTSPIAHGIMDYFDVTQDGRALEILQDAAAYLMNDNGYEQFGNGLCLHYSPCNPSLAYNSNAMAASFLLRLVSITQNVKMEDFATQMVNFVLDGQNPDGSWYYTDPKSKDGRFVDTIDNRHTGFVLEHLKIAAAILDRSELDTALVRGWNYYTQNLFDGYLPKWSPEQVYPIDIHDVAQAIITSLQMGEIEFSSKIMEFALNYFFNGKDEFYYKLFENGNLNKTVFIRWGQAWMFRAINKYLHCSI
jgi:hypothetical protein